MSVRINFLPAEYRPPKRMGFRSWASLLLGLAAAVALGAFYVNTYLQTLTDKVALREREEALAHTKAQTAVLDALRAREQQAATREAFAKAVGGRDLSNFLGILTKATPQTLTWLGLRLQGDTMTLNGTTRDLADVAQLYAGLVDEPGVANARLKQLDGQSPDVHLSGDGLLAFELIITLTPAEGGTSQGGN